MFVNLKCARKDPWPLVDICIPQVFTNQSASRCGILTHSFQSRDAKSIANGLSSRKNLHTGLRLRMRGIEGSQLGVSSVD